MKRNTNKKISEISSLNFVELSGSEQAVSEESFYNNQSVKQFVSKSFNALSAQIMKASCVYARISPGQRKHHPKKTARSMHFYLCVLGWQC